MLPGVHYDNILHESAVLTNNLLIYLTFYLPFPFSLQNNFTRLLAQVRIIFNPHRYHLQISKMRQILWHRQSFAQIEFWMNLAVSLGSLNYLQIRSFEIFKVFENIVYARFWACICFLCRIFDYFWNLAELPQLWASIFLSCTKDHILKKKKQRKVT